MKGKLGAILGMAAMFGAMSGMPMPSLSPRNRQRKTTTCPRLKAVEIPKGCHIETEVMEFITYNSPQYKISVEVDVVGATKKSILKERNRLRKALESFIESYHPNEIASISAFTVEPIITTEEFDKQIDEIS